MNGFVLQARSGHFKVRLENGETIDASARKKTMLASGKKSPVVAGDFAEIQIHEEGEATIEKLIPRTNSIQRGSENRRGKSHTIVANVDHALLVFAADKPRSRINAIDRFLVTSEYQRVSIHLIFNKWDLRDAEAEDMARIYQEAGYDVITTEALNKTEETRAAILAIDFQRLYVMGPSGVGKTSIMNAILPGLSAATKEVNQISGKGRHTTTHIEFREVEGARYLADTPGLGLLTMLGMSPNNLKNYYREFLDLAEECKYRSCLHLKEPGCAVRDKIGQEVHPLRYESYKLFLADLEKEDEELAQKGGRRR